MSVVRIRYDGKIFDDFKSFEREVSKKRRKVNKMLRKEVNKI